MIGEHTVVLIPDPDVAAWGPVLASNAFFNTDLAGWVPPPFSPAWSWAAPGVAVSNPGITAGQGLRRARAFPVPRDAATLYRIRARVTVAVAGWVQLLLYYGKDPEAAEIGPFWAPDRALQTVIMQNLPTAGSFTLEATFDPALIGADYAYLGPGVAFSANQQPRVDSIELNGQGSEQIDVTCLVDEVSIQHGRDDTDGQPEASTATITLSLDTGDEAFPDALDVGGIMRVTTSTELSSSTRIVGRITDIALGWEDNGPETPDSLIAQVMIASALSDLGRRTVGDTPYVQELDGARVARILAAAGITLDPTFSDPGTVQVLARDIDAQPALDLAQEVATSASGIVWQTRTGEVRYADADHRRGSTASLALDSCDVLVTPTWRRTSSGLVNRVSIGYGVAPDGGEQPRYVADNPASIDSFGRFELSTATVLAALADAQAMGQLLLVRNSSPVWIMAALPVDVEGLDAQDTAALLSLDMHSLLELTGLPVAGSAPTTAALWVEGWSETLRFGEHEIELWVSGYCRTAPAPRWDDIDPAWTWATVPSLLTWDDMTCLGPQPNRGRWNDVPASLRWNQVAPSITWDTWQ